MHEIAMRCFKLGSFRLFLSCFLVKDKRKGLLLAHQGYSHLV
jgi:hypothetical protein